MAKNLADSAFNRTDDEAGAWQHIAMTYAGTTIRLWHDGSEVASAARAGTPQDSTSFGVLIGQLHGAGYDGWIDEFRVTRGVARYTSSFTPTGPFPDA